MLGFSFEKYLFTRVEVPTQFRSVICNGSSTRNEMSSRKEETRAVSANRMISKREERIRQVVGGLLTVMCAIKYGYLTTDYASLSAGLAVGVGVLK